MTVKLINLVPQLALIKIADAEPAGQADAGRVGVGFWRNIAKLLHESLRTRSFVRSCTSSGKLHLGQTPANHETRLYNVADAQRHTIFLKALEQYASAARNLSGSRDSSPTHPRTNMFWREGRKTRRNRCTNSTTESQTI